MNKWNQACPRLKSHVNYVDFQESCAFIVHQQQLLDFWHRGCCSVLPAPAVCSVCSVLSISVLPALSLCAPCPLLTAHWSVVWCLLLYPLVLSALYSIALLCALPLNFTGVLYSMVARNGWYYQLYLVYLNFFIFNKFDFIIAIKFKWFLKLNNDKKKINNI